MAYGSWNYRYANAALTGIWTVPFIVLGVICIIKARRKGDPARVAFTWLKFVFPFAILYTILNVTANAAYIIYEQYIYLELNYALTRAQADALLLLNVRAGSVSYLFNQVTTALVLVTFVELGNGFMYARTHRRALYQKVFRWAAVFMAVVLVAMAIASCAWYSTWWDAYNGNSLTDQELVDRLDVDSKLNSSWVIMGWLFALANVAYASVAVHFWKGNPFVKGIAIEYLVATILMCIRSTYDLAYEGAFILGRGVLEQVRPPPDLSYFSSVMGPTPLGVAIVLLFVIAVHKRKGLWTTRQPFHGGVESAVGQVQQLGYAQPAQQGWQPQQPQPVHPNKDYGYGQPAANGY